MPRSTTQPDPNPSTLSVLSSLIELLPRMVSDRVQLLVLEVRRARGAVTLIAALAVGAVLMLVTAWFALWVGLAAALRYYDVSWPWVVAIIVVLNAGGAAVAGTRALGLVKLLGLPATVRRLTFAASPVTPVHAASTSPTATQRIASPYAGIGEKP